MPEGEDDALRAAAAHRGLKLIKSRRRKAGVGDYGRYGLTDGGGKELFGFGPDGLTALPADIRDYLRKAEVSTWAQSATVTPDRLERDRSEPDIAAADDGKEDASPRATHSDDRAKRTSRAAGAIKRRKQASSATKAKVDETPTLRALKVQPEPEPEPGLPLTIRAAGKADLKEIRALIGGHDAAPTLAARLTELNRAGGGAIVADRGRIVGCVTWHVILSLQDAPIGRLTLLVVANDERRQGLGRALIDAARSAMADQGCVTVEAMSDIKVRNVNGFYRALGFTEQSYRFVSDLAVGP